MIGDTVAEKANCGSLSNQPIVIDNGSGLIKAGFAGNDNPRVIFSSYVGTMKNRRMMPGGAFEQSMDNATINKSFVGRDVEQHRGLFKIRYAMEHGIVTNWDDMEHIWKHVYSKEMLNVNSEEHPVLLTEAPLNPEQNRLRAAEVFFECLNAPALLISPQAVLSLYASGRTTGVVLDCGDGVTHVVPVYESFALPHAIMRMDVAGRDVTRRLRTLLRKAGHTFHTSAELEVVREIKEQLCYVSQNPTKEEEVESKRHESGASLGALNDKTFTLPDGNLLTVGPERFRAAEVLFHPELLGLEYSGIHNCLVNSIMKTDLDLRKSLFSQIVLSGGTTMLEGFGERLLNEVRKKAPKDMKIRISAPSGRNYSTWTGGSILASLAAFKTMWIRKAEYEEHGLSAVQRKNLER